MASQMETDMTDTKALFELAGADDAEKLIAQLGKTESFRVCNDNGETLLLFSLYRGRTKCATALKSHGALTIQEAAATGDIARIEACFRALPSSLYSLSADGWPALHLASFLGQDATVARLLELGADAHLWARAVEQNLAIHAAAAGRRIGAGAFRALIAATGDPDVPQKQGYTALAIAASNGFIEGCEVLLAAGADRTRKIPDGRTAADIARERGHAELAKRLS
jgi:ankyrin repeat protein